MTSNASRIREAPRPERAPESISEVTDCLRTASQDHATVGVSGAGTAQCWGGMTNAQALLRTHNLDGVLRYEPADMTIQVGAGMRVADLQAVVAEHGQRLAIDTARIDQGATIGGLLATADQGPMQLAFGGPRDLVIGAGLVLMDGQVVRSGGHVIKNVAGYDLARMVCGSLGTLAVITDATFRLHPVPAATGTMALEVGIDEAVICARAIAQAGLHPVAAEWFSGRLLIRLEGTQTGVQDRLTAAAKLVGGAVGTLDATEANAEWKQHATIANPNQQSEAHTTVVRGLARPTDVTSLVQQANRITLEQEALPTVAAAVLSGRVDLKVDAVILSSHAAVVTRWRRHVENLGGSTILRHRSDELTDLISAWGAPPSAIDAMRAVKAAFDPDHLLEPGRFDPWF